MRQAQELQAKLAKAQEELSHTTLEVSSGGGAVKVIINGQQEIQSIKISPEAIDPDDVEFLEDPWWTNRGSQNPGTDVI